MPTTRLSDVIVPEVFAPYMLKKTMEGSTLLNSGILKQDPDLAKKLAAGGRTFNVPFWLDLEDSGSDIGSDDPDEKSTPDNIGSSLDVAVRQFRTKSWSSTNLAGVLAGDKPMERIGDRVSDWWKRDFERNLIALLNGVFASNEANNNGDMVLDLVNGDTGYDPVLDGASVLAGKQTMGDAAASLSTMLMHSMKYTSLQQKNLIEFIPQSEGKISIPNYLGYRVEVSDHMPVTGTPEAPIFHTWLLGRESIAFAEVPAPDAVDTDKQPDAGNGAGVETLYTRRQFAFHPAGHKFTDTSVAKGFPSNDELGNAVNWRRVYPERKQVPMVLIKSK